MANGTIAFDTLQTSDSANTGTTKSIDTSYIFNGVAKAWINFNGSGTVASSDSFNHSSLTDHGTGQYTNTISSAMSNATYVGHCDGGEPGTRDCHSMFPAGEAMTTTTHRCRTAPSNSADGTHDATVVCISINGDLA